MSESQDQPTSSTSRPSPAIAISRMRAELCALFAPIPVECLPPDLARLLEALAQVDEVAKPARRTA